MIGHPSPTRASLCVEPFDSRRSVRGGALRRRGVVISV
jgi:hypothetical protein